MKNAFILVFWLLTSVLFAGSINDAAKNPSMAVYSNTALANQTSAAFIPVAVSGAACNSTTDTIAITSDHSSQLICQSGAWQEVGIKAGGGQAQLWKALAGQEITCFGNEYYNISYYGKIDLSGNPYSRIVVWNSPIGVSDTGWIYGAHARNTVTGTKYPYMTLSLGGVLGQLFESPDYSHLQCIAYWN